MTLLELKKIVADFPNYTEVDFDLKECCANCKYYKSDTLKSGKCMIDSKDGLIESVESVDTCDFFRTRFKQDDKGNNS